MKNLKSIIYSALMLLIITACTSENDNLKNESQQIDYQNLNSGLKESIISFNKMVEYDKPLEQEINQYLESGDDSYFQKVASKKSIKESIVYTKEDLSDVYTDKQKEFLVKFYNELSNSEDGFILDVVLNYKDLLNSQNFSSEEYNQIYTLLIASEQSILVLDGIIDDVNTELKSSFSSKNSGGGFWDCMRQKAGRAIGEGLAQGAIVGAISGGYYGATGGTVVLPGIGTATGAVGGAVFGAAGGAVIGALGGAFWTARNCGGGGALKEFLEKARNINR